MDAAVAALMGAAIGAISSLGGVWIREKHQTHRDRLKIAADMGLADFNNAVDLLKQRRSGLVAPSSAYVIYHADLLDALAKEPITQEQLLALTERHEALMKACWPELLKN